MPTKRIQLTTEKSDTSLSTTSRRGKKKFTGIHGPDEDTCIDAFTISRRCVPSTQIAIREFVLFFFFVYLPDIFIFRIFLMSPGDTFVNCFSIYLQPRTHLTKTFLIDRLDLAKRCRSNIDQHIASRTKHIHSFLLPSFTKPRRYKKKRQLNAQTNKPYMSYLKVDNEG